MNRLHDHPDRRYKFIQFFLKHPRQLLVTLATGNEITNHLMTVFTTQLIYAALQPNGLQNLAPALNSFLITPLMLLLCDVTPKILGLKLNFQLSKIVSFPLFAVYTLLTPIRISLFLIVRIILNILRVPAPKDNPISENEFLHLIEQSTEDGHLETGHGDLIRNAFEFSDRQGREIMVSIEDAFLMESTLTVAEALPLMEAQGFSRVPVYTQHREHIVGIIYIRDLLKVRAHHQESIQTIKLRDVMRPAIFVPDATPIDRILKIMKKNKRQMIILKAQKATQTRIEAVGVLTMEDILEEIFGRIEDELDMESVS